LRKDAKTDPSTKRIVCLGAGGAGRAICVELALAGASHILVVNRPASGRGQALVETLNEKTSTRAHFHSWEGEFSVPEGTDVLVNAIQ